MSKVKLDSDKILEKSPKGINDLKNYAMIKDDLDKAKNDIMVEISSGISEYVKEQLPLALESSDTVSDIFREHLVKMNDSFESNMKELVNTVKSSQSEQDKKIENVRDEFNSIIENKVSYDELETELNSIKRSHFAIMSMSIVSLLFATSSIIGKL